MHTFKRYGVWLSVLAVILLGVLFFARSAALRPEMVAPQPSGSAEQHSFEVSLTIDDVASTTLRTIENGTSALDLLRTFSITDGFTLQTKVYPGMGTLVQKIGAFTNGTNKNYWQYFVNGTLAPVGADSYVMKPGDAIEWKFIPAQE